MSSNLRLTDLSMNPSLVAGEHTAWIRQRLVVIKALYFSHIDLRVNQDEF